MGDDTNVKVVVRIRPQISRDIIDLCHVCTSVTPGEPQVWLGKDKAFTFDQVFAMGTTQEEIYGNCVKSLIEGCFDGYNATVLAYGQTGSGKTYTMGTGFDINLFHDERGIIPRAVEHLFNEISSRQRIAKEGGELPPEFKVNAQFMELYNEEIIDLLDAARETEDKSKRFHIKIHEDAFGGIYTVGVIAQCVTSVEEAIQCLKLGALSRTTASTGMNAQSSRSHAIFTLHIKQQRIVQAFNDDACLTKGHEHGESLNEFETLTAKFHFVDLAGSERLKRTRATGERQKEGICINCGLLALGNVISALGDKSRKVTHVPYRDSKLTRLLQDSLGGNSRTLMIACISPSDRDFMETLNTLKYANRAKNIKNRVMVNQDKTSQTINFLRKEIERFQLELMEYKQGKRIVGDDGAEHVNDMYHENTMLQSENSTLRTRIKALQETVERLTIRNTELLAEKTTGSWIMSEGIASDITPVIQEYLKEIERLRAKLMESEEVCSYLRKHFQRPSSRLSTSPTSTVAVTGHYDIRMDSSPSVYELLEEAKEDVRKLKRKKKHLKGANVEKEKESGTVSEEEKEADEETELNAEERSEEMASSSESESDEQEDFSEDLAELTCEISIKQKLIEQLELSQRRLQNMRQHYEEKLIQLHNKIRETEKERDRVLLNLSKGSESQSEDKVRRVREDFEKKLITLQNDVKKMQAARKEHAQMMKNQAEYERQVKKLKQEVADMKRTKVRLVNKMKEEAIKHKDIEQRRNREIAQLKKESRSRENQIKTLEAEKKLKEAVLRRKQEEVTALRKRAKPMSDRVAGRLNHSRYGSLPQRYVQFSPKLAKQKWQKLEKKISKLVLNKQSISTIEKDMERWLHEREKLSRCLEKVLRKRDRALLEMKDHTVAEDLEEEIENLKANIDYIHENISDCQTSIVQMEETKDDMDAVDISSLLNNMQFEESKYLIEKLLNMAINQSFQAAQRDNTVKDLEAQLKQVVESNAVQQQLLQHVLHQANEDLYNIVMSSVDPENLQSEHSSGSASPVDNTNALEQLAVPSGIQGRRKARKKAATTEELLFPHGAKNNSDNVQMQPLFQDFDPMNFLSSKEEDDEKRTSIDSNVELEGSEFDFRNEAMKPRNDSTPSIRRKAYERLQLPETAVFPFKSPGSSDPKSPSLSRQNSVNASDITPPSSPSLTSRNRNHNVFSRLSVSSESSCMPDVGEIIPFTGKPPYGRHSILVCTHLAEGHSKAVLCVEATDDVLFSSSKDRTVKIWDLNTGQEIQQLGSHPNNVIKVRYCEYTRLAFTASMAYIKVWDVRENPSSCIKTLCSSGIAKNGPMVPDSPSRIIQIPAGENQINDIALNHYGTSLFSAAGNTVRMWDLKMFQSIGTLSGGHQAPVTCLAVDDLGMDMNLVISGSKDHFIKVFEVMEESRGIHTPNLALSPPHYDGIQALAINGDFLFSGSRDMCIKKWDLRKNCLLQSLNQAHKDWICSLSVLPSGNIFLSSCRSGCLKLWAADTCDLLEEVKAHNATINCIAANSTNIFTASNDCTIGIWRLRSTPNASPDFDFGNDRILQ